MNFHRELVMSVFGEDVSDEGVLCIMLLLHVCAIELSESSKEKYKANEYVAITSRHAAEVVAKIFSDKERCDYAHWYWLWNGDWNACGIPEKIPDQLIPVLVDMKNKIEDSPMVEKLVDDDFDLIKQIYDFQK